MPAGKLGRPVDWKALEVGGGGPSRGDSWGHGPPLDQDPCAHPGRADFQKWPTSAITAVWLHMNSATCSSVARLGCTM